MIWGYLLGRMACGGDVARIVIVLLKRQHIKYAVKLFVLNYRFLAQLVSNIIGVWTMFRIIRIWTSPNFQNYDLYISHIYLYMYIYVVWF